MFKQEQHVAVTYLQKLNEFEKSKLDKLVHILIFLDNYSLSMIQRKCNIYSKVQFQNIKFKSFLDEINIFCLNILTRQLT